MLWYLFSFVATVGAVASLLAATRVYLRTRGLRVVHCPATHGSASVRVAPTHPFVLRGPVHLGVARCSLWPERAQCAQACLAEIAESPQHCSFQRVLADWYRGQRCAICRRDIPKVQRGELRPGLLAPNGELVAWTEVPPTQLYEVLASHRPVCAHCEVAETFRRRYADWVIERPRSDGPHDGPAA
jgi:hypothetical protein